MVKPLNWSLAPVYGAAACCGIVAAQPYLSVPMGGSLIAVLVFTAMVEVAVAGALKRRATVVGALVLLGCAVSNGVMFHKGLEHVSTALNAERLTQQVADWQARVDQEALATATAQAALAQAQVVYQAAQAAVAEAQGPRLAAARQSAAETARGAVADATADVARAQTAQAALPSRPEPNHSWTLWIITLAAGLSQGLASFVLTEKPSVAPSEAPAQSQSVPKLVHTRRPANTDLRPVAGVGLDGRLSGFRPRPLTATA